MRFKLFLEQEEKPKEYSEKELADREKKKSNSIATLRDNIRSLKMKLASDLKSDNEKTKLTALAISLINATAERVGGEDSANGIGKDENGKTVKKEPHHGITGLKTSHVTFADGKATLNYIAKSGVEQTKTINDGRLVSLLKDYNKKNKEFLFVTDDGYKLKADRVNRYLKDYDVSAKDLRGFAANDLIIKALNGREMPKEESERKKVFLDVAKKIAEKLGHSPTMLRNSYLLPKLEDTYIQKGKVTTLNDI